MKSTRKDPLSRIVFRRAPGISIFVERRFHIECAVFLIAGVAIMATLKVGVVMGSESDWPVMEHAVKQLEAFGVPYEARVVSAHRTPDLLFEYAASARGNGLACIIAGAGGAAHLPGMLASKSTVPVLGVPVPSRYLKGMDSLLSIVQMPKGIPVATFAIGEAGAANAALYAIAILAVNDSALAARLEVFRREQQESVLAMHVPPGD